MSQFDLIIIGGGINGVAIAQQASRAGKRVALFEKSTLGAGASSHTSKLAHGGLRYLETFEFGLVRESVRERDLLVTQYPELVTPLPFIFPVYKSSKRPLWQVKIGMRFYDFFSRKGHLPKHRHLTASQVAQLAPGLQPQDLVGGVLYYDAQVDDLALLQQLAHEAKSHGALIQEHSPVTCLLYRNHIISGVEVMHNGQSQHFEATHIINVSGAWSNTILHMDSSNPKVGVSPTKGVHLIVPRITGDHALILSAPQDQRVFFMMPWKDDTLIGTTDTLYKGNPDQVRVLAEDIRYLLDATHFYFPAFSPNPSSVLSTYCGLRPLVGSTQTEASSISRDFVISQSDSGLWTMLGGKYTTHRHMAERLLAKVFFAKEP